MTGFLSGRPACAGVIEREAFERLCHDATLSADRAAFEAWAQGRAQTEVTAAAVRATLAFVLGNGLVTPNAHDERPEWLLLDVDPEDVVK